MKKMRENLIKYYNDVLLWNFIGGNRVENKNLIHTYVGLVDEESNETIDGLKKEDQIEVIDGVIDSLVVGSYLYAVKRDVSEFSNVNFDTVDMPLFDLIYKMEELKDHYRNDDGNLKDEFSDHIEEFMSYAEAIYVKLSKYVDVEGAFEEILKSNWSKYPTIESVDADAEIVYIEAQGRYSGVYSSVSKSPKGDSFFVFKEGTKGKVVKPSVFKEPSLQKYIYKDFL